MILFWIVVFVISLIILVKGADWLLESASRLGLSFGLSPFIIGVTIVGLGTSFPELMSSLVAVWQGAGEIVVANAVGSNIANILLIVGLSAIVAKRLVVTKNLIDLDLPLLAISTSLFLVLAWDGLITVSESIILLLSFLIYFAYTIIHREDDEEVFDKSKLNYSDFVWLLVGIFGLVFGSKYLIDSVINLSEILNIGVGVIAISAVALGTSLPELLVSTKAAWQKKSEIAIGNIFGSNVFNILFVVGFPGLFTNLYLDAQTLALGLPVMIIATLLFVFSGISKQIHIWEGTLFLVLYFVFIGKLFGLI